jgi:hypothetical protein
MVWNGVTWVPDPVRNPSAPGAKLWGAVPTSTTDPAALRKQYATDEATLTAERTASTKNRRVRELLSNFEAANSVPKRRNSILGGGGTGGFLAQHTENDRPSWGIDVVGGLKALTFDTNPQVQAMKSASGDLQTGVPRPGDNSVSNFERRLYAQGIPSVDKYGGVNQNIINNMRATQNEHSDYVDFLEAYRSSNGSLAGAEGAWNKYVAQNPYRSIEKVSKKQVDDYGFPASGKIVAKRPAKAMPWKQYFGLEPIAQAAGAAQPKGPARVTSDADYKKLPSGTVFIDPEGKMRRKP